MGVVLRGALVAELGGRFMFGSVPGVNHPLWYRVRLDGPTPCVWLVCVKSSGCVGRVLNIPVDEDPTMFSCQALRVHRTLCVSQTLIFCRRMLPISNVDLSTKDDLLSQDILFSSFMGLSKDDISSNFVSLANFDLSSRDVGLKKFDLSSKDVGLAEFDLSSKDAPLIEL